MNKTVLAYIIALVVPLAFYVYFDNQEMPEKKRLKRFIPLSTETQQANKELVNDTLWQTLPNFSFITQKGEEFTNEQVKDKVLLIGFFASWDENKLTKMNEYFRMFQEEFEEDKEVVLLSHTVTPSIDTLERLQELVQEYKIDDERWYLLSGKEADIYRQIEKGYDLPLPILKDSSNLESLSYPSKYVLVGRKGIIRGYYDLENLQDVRILMSDIRWLQLEYPTKHKREIQWKLKEKESEG